MGQSIDTHCPQHTKDSSAQGYYTIPSRDRQRTVAVRVKEGKGKGGRVREEERKTLFVLLLRMRVVERTCLLRACITQQPAGQRGETEREREREIERQRERDRDRKRETWSMPNNKWTIASVVLLRWVKHDGRKGWT